MIIKFWPLVQSFWRRHWSAAFRLQRTAALKPSSRGCSLKAAFRCSGIINLYPVNTFAAVLVSREQLYYRQIIGARASHRHSGLTGRRLINVPAGALEAELGLVQTGPITAHQHDIHHHLEPIRSRIEPPAKAGVLRQH